MHFLRDNFNFKHKKLDTNDSASKAKSCHCCGKTWFIKTKL